MPACIIFVIVGWEWAQSFGLLYTGFWCTQYLCCVFRIKSKNKPINILFRKSLTLNLFVFINAITRNCLVERKHVFQRKAELKTSQMQPDSSHKLAMSAEKPLHITSSKGDLVFQSVVPTIPFFPSLSLSSLLHNFSKRKGRVFSYR